MSLLSQDYRTRLGFARIAFLFGADYNLRRATSASPVQKKAMLCVALRLSLLLEPTSGLMSLWMLNQRSLFARQTFRS